MSAGTRRARRHRSSPEAPIRLFEGDYLFPRAGPHYDVSTDGQRFLMIKPGTGTDAMPIPEAQVVLVHSWLEDLKQRAPSN